jgi:acetyl-CoA synthetase
MLAERLNPLFRVGRVEVLDSLPRTASNKIIRRALRALR